ncbi:MAG: hypothetical protein EA402_04505 [Planctomycetota bacterium]|nr:MAG: hypothetical protein EA402_04505 [Planctomycetota bacterium]
MGFQFAFILFICLGLWGCSRSQSLTRYEAPIIYRIVLNEQDLSQQVRDHADSLNPHQVVFKGAFEFSMAVALGALGLGGPGSSLQRRLYLLRLGDSGRELERHSLFWGDNYFVAEEALMEGDWNIVVDSYRLQLTSESFVMPVAERVFTLILDLDKGLLLEAD